MKRVFLFLLICGCVDRSDLFVNAPCPCVEGYRCCEAYNVCLPPGRSCPGDLAPSFAVESISPDEGDFSGGTSVVIRGTNLTTDLRVSFGGVLCQDIVLQDETEIACSTPQVSDRISRVDVVLFAEDGRRAVLKGGFRYLLPPFVDVTESAGLGPTANGVGVAIADVNDDRLPDLFFTAQIGARFFLGEGNMRWRENSGDWEELGETLAVASGDFNNDDHTDLLVTTFDNEVAAYLLLGDGAGEFAVAPQRRWHSDETVFAVHPVDLDGDGDLDVLGCRSHPTQTSTVPIVVAENVAGELIEDPSRVTVGPPLITNARCEAAAVADYDADGDADLVTCGNQVTLYRNDAGHFIDVTTEVGIPRITDCTGRGCDCRSIDFVDIDADGDLDISYLPYGAVYVHPEQREWMGTTIFASNRDRGATTFSRVTGLDRGSIFNCAEHRNAIIDGVALIGGSRAGTWLDHDQDGDLDLLLPVAHPHCRLSPVLYEGLFVDGWGEFDPLVLSTGVYAAATGVAAGDLDGDGDVDAVIHSVDSSHWGVLKNNLREGESRSQYLQVRVVADSLELSGVLVEVDLDGPAGAPDFELGDGRLLARMIAPTGRGSSGPPVATFGLADRTAEVSVRVRFPDGSIATRQVATFDQIITIADCDEAVCP